MSSISELKTVDELRKLLKDFTNECLQELYQCAFLAGPERRHNIFKKGFELAKNVGDSYNQSLFEGWIAWDNINRGNVDKALVLAKEAVALDRKTGNQELLPLSIGVLGCVHQVLGNWDKSEKYFKEAFRLSKRRDDHYLITGVHWWLGWFYFDKQDYIKAKEHYEKVYEECKKVGDIEGQINSYPDVIWMLIELGEIEKAKTLIDNMDRLIVETNNKKYIASLNVLKGTLFRAEKRWKESISYFEKSLKQHEALNSRQFDVYWFTKMVLTEYARVYMERNQEGDKEKANNLLNQALENYQKLGAKKAIEKIVAKKKMFAQ